jgi:glycosyltransferase involved in cell wall biosynthesis
VTPTVAVCVPTIPTREHYLRRAIESIGAQTRQPDRVQVVADVDSRGAAWTRNQAWRDVDAELIAFLDDDDEWYPQHLERLLDAFNDDVDLVYPWFDLPHGVDPLAVRVGDAYVSPYGLEFGDDHRKHILTEGNFIPITVLVRRSLLEQVNGFPQPGSERWPHDHCEDWGCWQDMLRAGARFRHVPERTWVWHWHGQNTSGRPWRRV